MQLIRVAERLGVRLPVSPPPGPQRPGWTEAEKGVTAAETPLHVNDLVHARRISQRVQLWEHDCLLHDGTCGTRKTTKQGHRPPCQRETGEPLWSPGSWRSASASRQEGRRPAPVEHSHDHLVEDQLGNLHDLLNSQDHGDQLLRHDRNVDDLDCGNCRCTTKGMSTNSKNCTCKTPPTLPPRHPSSRTIQEPTLGLLGAAPDGCNC